VHYFGLESRSSSSLTQWQFFVQSQIILNVVADVSPYFASFDTVCCQQLAVHPKLTLTDLFYVFFQLSFLVVFKFIAADSTEYYYFDLNID